MQVSEPHGRLLISLHAVKLYRQVNFGASRLEHVGHAHGVAVIEEFFETVCTVVTLFNFFLEFLNKFEKLVYLVLLIFVARSDKG